MRRTGRTPIDDDAEKAETRPLEASMPLSIKGKNKKEPRKYGVPWKQFKADNGNRTRLSSLGSWRSTDELYLHGFSIAYP